MTQSLTAEPRMNGTKGELKRLRSQGKIPGVLFGKMVAPSPITLEEKELLALLRSHPKAVLELTISQGNKENVMITEVQRDSLSRQVLHVDLHKVNMNEAIHAAVRLDLVGDSAGVREGGILQAIVHEVEVECLPGDLPESIAADVTALGVGENLLVKDLKLPPQVKVKSDPSLVVVTVLAPQKELSEEEAHAADHAAEAEAARAEEARRHSVALD
ncbi:50S ribosomal protein L25/general stress protein Ctc [Paenibacillus protaetiae]|uniref:Large ribosomal subunit protein bL25 n=1 Tax=Paenibacillus protaetiae TaxID=2509456 RepID=A0A4P6EVX7_9BACL|nr:50S ribosomal protein L25/general stress protein Ctc [Paenibacillus protaetiae]QAY67460.1 50S ribosomal protein L25/general stress protein Ctc [Paenibacillus protaetiae]